MLEGAFNKRGPAHRSNKSTFPAVRDRLRCIMREQGNSSFAQAGNSSRQLCAFLETARDGCRRLP